MPPLTGQQVWGFPGVGGAGEGEGENGQIQNGMRWEGNPSRPNLLNINSENESVLIFSDVRSVDVVIPLRHSKPYSVSETFCNGMAQEVACQKTSLSLDLTLPQCMTFPRSCRIVLGVTQQVSGHVVLVGGYDQSAKDRKTWGFGDSDRLRAVGRMKSLLDSSSSSF